MRWERDPRWKGQTSTLETHSCAKTFLCVRDSCRILLPIISPERRMVKSWSIFGKEDMWYEINTTICLVSHGKPLNTCPIKLLRKTKILSNEDFSYLYTFRKIQKVLWPMIKIDVSILTMMSDSVAWYNNSHNHYFMKKLLIYWSIILPCILFPFCALLILILSDNLEKGWQFLILLIGLSLFALYLFYSYCIYFIAKNLGEITAWFAFIPFFNFGVLLRMANMSIWWMFGLFIPLLNIFIVIKAIHNGISLRTGHGVNWTIGLLLFWVIFLPLTAIWL